MPGVDVAAAAADASPALERAEGHDASVVLHRCCDARGAEPRRAWPRVARRVRRNDKKNEIDLALFFCSLEGTKKWARKKSLSFFDFFLLFFKASDLFFSLLSFFSDSNNFVFHFSFVLAPTLQAMPPRYAPRYGDVTAAGEAGQGGGVGGVGGYGGARIQTTVRGEIAAPAAASVGAFVQGLLSARGACARASDVANLFRVIEGGQPTGERVCVLCTEREREKK